MSQGFGQKWPERDVLRGRGQARPLPTTTDLPSSLEPATCHQLLVGTRLWPKPTFPGLQQDGSEVLTLPVTARASPRTRNCPRHEARTRPALSIGAKTRVLFKIPSHTAAKTRVFARLFEIPSHTDPTYHT